MLLLLLYLSKSKNTNTQVNIPIASLNPIPTLNNSYKSIKFQVLSTDAPKEPVYLARYINVKFSKPILQDSLAIDIVPAIDLKTVFDNSDTLLTIQPKLTWDPDTSYKITILKSTQSVDNTNLSNDYVITFKTEAMAPD